MRGDVPPGMYGMPETHESPSCDFCGRDAVDAEAGVPVCGVHSTAEHDPVF